MSNDILIKSKAIPSNPRSKNYPAGTSIVRSGGGTTTITGGGGTSVDILKVDDVRSLTDRNVFSSLRTLAEILSRIIKKDDIDTELSDENTLSSLRVKAAIDALKDEYISKIAPDETAFLLKALGGLIVGDGLDVTDGISTDTLTSVTATTQILNVLNKLIGVDADFSGNLQVDKKITTLNLLVKELADIYDLNVSHVATLMGTVVKEYISSESFVSGFSGEGMKIYKALNGDWNMEIDNLTVRKIFSVFELTVQKITHQGGMVIRSAAGAKLTKVTDGGTYWKCEHDSTDDFVKDDQIICQSFTGTTPKRYWRLVTSSGVGYFNLSKTDSEQGSATPESGDEVAVLGNRTISARQKAQIDCAVGDTSPYRDDYDNINSYSLIDKLITRTGNLSGITDAVFGVLSGSGLYGTNVYLRGTFILKSGKSVESELNAINSIAASAQSTANVAKQSAENAALQAETSTRTLSDIASDSKFTPSEKQAARKEWDVITSEKAKNDASSDKFSIDKTAYNTAYTQLSSYIIPLLSSLVTTSDIDGNVFRSKFKAYYDTRTDLLNTISEKAKSLADSAQQKANEAANAAATAQTKANEAASAASTAQSAATNAQSAANGANALLSDMASDNKLTATEKQTTKKEWDVIVSEKPLNNASAVKFGMSTSVYDTAYNTLNTYITPLLSSLTTTSDISGADFRSKFKAYYDARTNLLNSISEKAKALADSAQQKANELGTRITTVETNFEIREGQISSKVTEAIVSAGNARQSETNASGSATSAGTSATNAAKSASDALGAATNAEKILEEVTIKESSITQTAGQIATKVTEVNKKVTEAETAASNAKKSETNASSSANTSSTKAGEAASSATNAGNSASSASGSAGTATVKAGEAASSATNAKKSADDAAAKLVTITEKESSIDQTARGITLQVKEVQTKATEAAGSAGTASTKAGEAATSASNAKASENAAASLVANADGKFVTKTVYESRIKALSDSIELKVAKTEFNELGVRVSSAESSITQNAQQIALKVSASEAGSIADSKVGALKGDLQATGIDIANRKITVTADTFQVQDNYGNAIAVFKTDAAGKPVIKAENIDTKNLVVESGAIIGGFKVDGYNLSNRDNSDCWVNIDYKSGDVRRISSLGNNFPDTAGVTPAGYFSATGPGGNKSLILVAKGSTTRTDMYGGYSNHAIEATGGCKWKMNAGDHWCMPGVLWAGLFNCNNWTPSLEKSWGNGCSVRLASRDRAGVYRFSHDLGHNDYHIQAMHSAQVREDWNWWTLTTAFLNIDSSGFSLMFRRIDGAEVDPLQFQIVVFGRTKK